MTSYFLYIQDNREAVQKELGVKDFGPVTKCLSDRWKNLSASAKATFDKKAADLKAGYEKAVVAFKEAGGVVGQKRKDKKDAKADKAAKKQKKEDNVDKPKKPAGGGYGVYISENRAEIHKGLPAGSSVTAISKVGGARWKALSEKEKAPYEAKYQTKKAKYEEELKAWKASKPEAAGDDEEDDDAEEEAEDKPTKARKAGA